jgi:limonene-1,2-epoxide hydrolase
MTDLIEIVENFFTAWSQSFEALIDSLETTFAVDAVWENPGMTPRTTKQESIDHMRSFQTRFGIARINVVIDRIAAAGYTVFTERVDDIIRNDGSTWLSDPVAGVMDFNDEGKIVRWREYFDPRAGIELLSLGR